jgi:UDP-glucose 4-epimerase
LGKSIPYQFVERRSGDIAVCYANATLAKNLLNWNAKLSLADMCIDSWRWQSNDFS